MRLFKNFANFGAIAAIFAGTLIATQASAQTPPAFELSPRRPRVVVLMHGVTSIPR